MNFRIDLLRSLWYYYSNAGERMLNHTAKMLFYDVECSDITLQHNQYDLTVKFKRYGPDSIVRDWTMFSGAWKLLGCDKVECVSISPRNPFNDYEVIRRLHKALSDADILIGHNSDAFDLKKFNARAIIYDLPPIGKKQQIDTLKIARKYFKFTSNKLSYLANILKISAKDDSPDWEKVKEGNVDEIRAMREYNKQDVIVTEQLYLKLRSYHDTHPNIPVYSPMKDISGNKLSSCPKCNSLSYKLAGFRYSNAGKYQRCVCHDCGGWFTIGKLIRA